MAKTDLATVGGFTPVIDSIVKAAGQVTALVFGRVWRFCQMEDGVCKASLETIASGAGLDKTTVQKHIKRLCVLGYLIDRTPGVRHKPHIYADTGKASLRIHVDTEGQMEGNEQINRGIAEINPGVAEVNAGDDEINTGDADINPGVAEINTRVDVDPLKIVFKKEQDRKREREEIDFSLDFSNLSLEEARKSPGLALFEESAGFLPDPSTWAFVDTTVREQGLTAESIHEAAETWARRGYRRENVEGILDWAVNGVPLGKSASRGVNGKAKRLPRPSLLCSDGTRLKEFGEERNEAERVTRYWEHLKTCHLCSSASNIEETLRELEKMMKR